MEIKPYTVSTVVALLAAGGMGVAAATNSLQPLAKNNARNDALLQITKYLEADNCLNFSHPQMPKIGTTIDVKGKGQLSTSCIYYPQYKRFAYVAQLENQLQVIYLYTNTEVRKAKNNDEPQ